MEDRYYTIKRVAEELGKSRPTVYKMIREGKLRVKQIAGRPAVLVSDVQRLQQATTLK